MTPTLNCSLWRRLLLAPSENQNLKKSSDIPFKATYFSDSFRTVFRVNFFVLHYNSRGSEKRRSWVVGLNSEKLQSKQSPFGTKYEIPGVIHFPSTFLSFRIRLLKKVPNHNLLSERHVSVNLLVIAIIGGCRRRRLSLTGYD